MYEETEERIVIDKKSSMMVYTVRKRHGYSQSDFGKMLGYSQAKISRIESLKDLPTEDLLREIADRFGYELEELTGQKPMKRRYSF